MNDPDILRANLETARKFRAIEVQLTACGSIAELFVRLFQGTEGAFAIPFVWVSLLERPDAEPVLAALKGSLLRERVNVISPSAFLEIVPDPSQPLLAAGDLRPFFRLLPSSLKYVLRSLAVAPLALNGSLIGSLNHGDASARRYRPGMETALLAHLAQEVSGHLSRLLEADGSANLEKSL
jgi:uncharacterized protein YigA (DUF484 family)